MTYGYSYGSPKRLDTGNTPCGGIFLKGLDTPYLRRPAKPVDTGKAVNPCGCVCGCVCGGI